MALTLQAEIFDDMFILRCDRHIVFGDECAVLRERVGSMLSDTPKIVVNLNRYGHFGLEDLRSAVETISRSPEGKIEQGSPVNPPGMSESPNAKIN